MNSAKTKLGSKEDKTDIVSINVTMTLLRLYHWAQ